MQESNFNVIIDTENYNAVIGESAKIDVGQAINNIQSGKAEIEAAVQDGKAAFNLNATAKTGEFNQNAVDKTGAFDDNATAKTGDFNTNATDKTTAFDNNYTAKLGAFNDNAATKQAEVDASAALAKQYAIGEPSEPTGNSAKYWAEQASGSLSGLTSRVTTIEGKIPSAASSSNQLADKDWVGNQGYITGITSGDVTTALGYTPYNSTNPDGYISGITSGDVTTALGYTPYNASNPNGYTSNVGTVTSVNNTSPDGSGNVTITIPNPLPSQAGHSGEFLTTDGTDASWGSPDLSGKANIDLSNCTKPYVVETYTNGTSWYRVYSDGWVEQGLQQTTAGQQLTFLKPFADTNYTVASAVWEQHSGGLPYIISKTSTTITLSYVNDIICCGYGASN